jgi:hypothetical protein
MRLQLRFTILACCVLAGCRGAQPPVTRDALVGNYAYKSEDPEGKATDHSLDRLVLQADGKYDLVQGGTTKPRTETVGTWTIWDEGGNGPEVILDHSGYPIQGKENEIRLLINNDVGIWYVKAK